MKHKFMIFDNWQKIVPPNSWPAFSLSSPISSVGGPFIAYRLAGIGTVPDNNVFTRIGTIMACRTDLNDYPDVLNTNYWYVDCIGSLKLVEITDVENKTLIPEHHSGTIPSVFLSAPNHIKQSISDEINKNSKLINSLLSNPVSLSY